LQTWNCLDELSPAKIIISLAPCFSVGYDQFLNTEHGGQDIEKSSPENNPHSIKQILHAIVFIT
jgi:hypothetical protein